MADAAYNQASFLGGEWSPYAQGRIDVPAYRMAMNICLNEIKRCQQTTPRPNFIVLLGDRYGWCPPPSQIPASEFAKILQVVSDVGDKTLLDEWYGLDENAVPPEWRLKPRLPPPAR